MYDLAYTSLVIALILCFYGIFIAIYSGAKRNYYYLRSAYNSVISLFILITVCVAILLRALIVNDYSLEYAAMHSNRAMPLMYKITALWGGQEGSILFWAWVLLLYSIITVLLHRRKHLELMPAVTAILLSITAFFISILVFSANPFKILAETLPDGKGLNPLLQDPGMVFHPPALYLGFVGFSIPFAYATASLLSGKMDITWIKITRKWTLVSWFFLGIGIILGAQWAYIELGWGGYWAWDPVENASLIPWLTATAYIHSVMIQEKKDMLRMWNIILVLTTFFLCILGTFITRSGIISSVHSFEESSIGSFFLVFLSFILFFSLALLLLRLDQIKGKQKLESVVSRESSFLFNNLLFMGMAIAVLWGTIFPVISEAITGKKITVGAPFFNRVLTPLMFLLLLLTGLCPFIAWRKANVRRLIKNILIPFLLSIPVVVLLVIMEVKLFAALLFSFACSFVAFSIVIEFYKGTRARQSLKKEFFLSALLKLVIRNKRRYLGFVVHLSIVIMFVGIIGSGWFGQEKEVVLKKGESIHFGNYILRYKSLNLASDENKTSVKASIEVLKNAIMIEELYPGKDFHVTSEQPMSQVAIYSTWKEDLYTVLVGWEEDETASFKFYLNPLVSWIWIGSIIMIVASFFLLLPEWSSSKTMKKGTA